jgi:hypothetical protein
MTVMTEYMATQGVTAYMTMFVYPHHQVVVNHTAHALNINIGGSHISLLCHDEAHKILILNQLMQDLTAITTEIQGDM